MGFWDEGVQFCGNGRYLRDKEDEGSIVEAVGLEILRIWKMWGPIQRHSKGERSEILGKAEIVILAKEEDSNMAKVIGLLWAEMGAGQTARWWPWVLTTILGCRYLVSVHGTPSTAVK